MKKRTVFHLLINDIRLIILLLVTLIIIIFIPSGSSPVRVRAQTANGFAFLNELGLPWRCGDEDPRTVSQDWNDHWAIGSATGAAIDFTAPGENDYDKDILAPTGGIIHNREERDENGNLIRYGRYVEIEANGISSNGWTVRIAHLLSFSANDGSLVQKGQLVGHSDNSGKSYGSHIHLELLWMDGQPDPGWFNSSGHFLFSHPTDVFIPSRNIQFYSNNCSTGSSTSLYWDANWNGLVTHYFGFGNFRVPDWFNDQASSFDMDEPQSSVTLFEHAGQSGGARPYFQDDSDFANDQFNNGVGVNDKVSSLLVGGGICPAGFVQSLSATDDPCIVPTPTSQPPPPASGWNQTFFSDNNLGTMCGSRSETDVYMFRDSDGGWSPPTGCPGVESPWSVRMERNDAYFQGGTYEFGLFYDDAARLYVDGQLRVDGWIATQHYESQYISPGNHNLRLEYKNNAGYAIVQLWWRGPGALPPNSQVQDPNQWWVNYWGNQTQWHDAVGSINEGTGFLSHDWGYGGPGFGIPEDHFSLRFERTLYFDCGIYRFHLSSDDGSRIWIDGALVPEFNHWSTNVWNTTADISLEAGSHTLKVDYFENGGNARVYLDWTLISLCAPILTPTPPPCPAISEWKGLYWDNQNLSGQFSLCRNDEDLNFNWGDGSPDPIIPSDNFSARWTKQVQLDGGFYTFIVFHDDGFRLLIDGSVLFENWCSDCRATDRMTWLLASGSHEIMLEYFENNGWAAIRLNWLPYVAGDANSDGKVDGIDYVIWLNHYNQYTNNGAYDGDYNGDGKVDGIDYVIWLNNYGQ